MRLRTILIALEIGMQFLAGWLYSVRRGMRRFHESRIVLQLSGRKQGVILTVTSRKEEHQWPGFACG